MRGASRSQRNGAEAGRCLNGLTQVQKPCNLRPVYFTDMNDKHHVFEGQFKKYTPLDEMKWTCGGGYLILMTFELCVQAKRYHDTST
jgi:hypothetical protein